MKFTLSDVWQSVLAMLIRFFDQRFIKLSDPKLSLLEAELFRKDKLIEELISAVTANQAKVVEDNEPNALKQDFKPIKGFKSWRQKAAELTEESRRKVHDVDELEQELGVK